MKPAHRWLLALLTITLAASLPVKANDLPLTAIDQERQRAFIRAMDTAAGAAKAGNRTAAQKALRQAVLAGGYSLPSAYSAAYCGHMAFEMPIWVMEVQAAVGDVEGAVETARNTGSANNTLFALYTTALMAAGDERHRTRSLRFREAMGAPTTAGKNSDRPISWRLHDYTVLRQLFAPPNPIAAQTILQEAVPYAEAVKRVESDLMAKKKAVDQKLLMNSINLLAGFQAEVGDVEGARATIYQQKTLPNRTLGLLHAARILSLKKQAGVEEMEKEAQQALAQLPDSGQRVDVLWTAAWEARRWEDRAGLRHLLQQAVQQAISIPEPSRRAKVFDNLISGIHELVSPIDKKAEVLPEDITLFRTALCAARDSVSQMPPDPAWILNAKGRTIGENSRHRCNYFYDIALEFAWTLKDRTEALTTYELARKVAEQEATSSLKSFVLWDIARMEEETKQRLPETKR